MNYVITYWLPPDSPPERRQALRRYFDLQRRSKQRFGGYQTIVTNLDYDNAVPFEEPPGFGPEHGILAKWLGLGQMIDRGMSFPIMMHDHDVFIRAPIAADPDAICSAFAGEAYISDQIVIVPEKCRGDVEDYVARLKRFDFMGGLRSGYGSETRHEGRYSSEVVQTSMNPRPFADTPQNPCIRLRDLVSFDIGAIHSLDPGSRDCNPIPEDVQAVHGHLNRGNATDSLIRWLAR